MKPEFILLLVGLVVLIVAYILIRQAMRGQDKVGLPTANVSVVYSDSGAWEEVAKPLFSARYRLTGKPDYVLQTRDGLIPIELKPLRQANRPYGSDIMQLAAYCLLLEEAWGKIPPYGLLRYKEHTFRVEWTAELKADLLEIMADMRELLEFPAYQNGPLPEPQHDMTVRCHSCGFQYICWPNAEGG